MVNGVQLFFLRDPRMLVNSGESLKAVHDRDEVCVLVWHFLLTPSSEHCCQEVTAGGGHERFNDYMEARFQS